MPLKVVPFSVADVPTRQKILQGFAVPVMLDSVLAVSELPTLNTNTPGPFRTNVADEGKSGAPVVNE